jgi:hypothetical protein
MLEKLKNRWKVNTLNLVLILCTFALGGSLCGKAGRYLLNAVVDSRGPSYWIAYLLLITLLWPFSVLLVSIPLGQYRFFTNYLKKVWKRISGRSE